MSRFLGLIAVVLVMSWAPLVAEAQTGTIQGRVVNSQNLESLELAQIALPGFNRGTVSDADGTYEIANVPVGTHTITVELIGYGSASQEVTVAQGQTVTVNFQLAAVALALDEIIVTGTAGEQRRRAVGNVVANISGDIAEVAPVRNISDLIKGRVSGVMLRQGEGMAGSASVIRIRGQASLTASNQPLIYVDGVRVNNSFDVPNSPGSGSGSAVSRLNDFTPEEIESIEIIKGPAASTLYGTEAAHGVIAITTKRGVYDRAAAWTFSVRGGSTWFNDPAGHTPTNWGINSATGQPDGVNMVTFLKDGSTVNSPGPAGFEGYDFFKRGPLQEYSASVSGGSSNVRYFVSATVLDEESVTEDSYQDRYNFRANVGTTPMENMTIDASMGVTLHRARVPGTGSNSSALRGLWLGRPSLLGTARTGFHRAPPDAIYEKAQLFTTSNRVTTSLQVNHRALDWLTHRLTVGLDLTDTRNSQFNPFLSEFAGQFWTGSQAEGLRDDRQETWLETSFDYGASATADLSDAVRSTTSVGFQVNTKKRDQTFAFGRRFPTVGVSTVDAAAETSGESNVIENNTVGVYAQQQFGWEDRRFLTVAIRADDNSAFGSDFSLVTYPKVSASWVVSEESFWNLGFVNALRLRSAFGASGQQPDVFAAVRTFSPSSLPDGTPAVRPGKPGNSELGPERAQEFEAGFDASLFNDRLALDFTYYSQVTKDAIVARNVAPSSGFDDDQFVNIGEMTNKGFEVGMYAGLIDTDGFDWDLNFTVGTNENEIKEIGLEGGAGIQLGLVTQHKRGFPAASIFATHIVETLVDAQGNVTSVLCQDAEGPARGDRGSTGTINCSDAPQVYRGHPDPNAQGSLGTTFTFGDVRLDVLSDFAIGQQNYSVWGWWHFGTLKNAEACWVDRSSHTMTGDSNDYLGFVNTLGACEFGSSREMSEWAGLDSGYWKLREITLSSPIPGGWLDLIGASQGTASLAARNIMMLWTNYKLYPFQDPEVRWANAALRGGDPGVTAKLPPLQQLILSVRLTY